MSKIVKALYLEDDTTFVELVRGMLHKHDFDCELEHVETRKEYKSALNERDFDLILSDYDLCDIDGLTALEIRKLFCPDTPFILIADNLETEQIIALLRGGATDYLDKDDIPGLGYIIERALDEASGKKQRILLENDRRNIELRFEHLVNASPSIVYTATVDKEHQYTFVSGNLDARLGYQPEEMTYNPGFWYSKIHPEDRKSTIASVNEQFAKNKSGSVEYRFAKKSGEYIWIYDSFSATQDGSSVEELVGTWTDISAHKKAEQANRQLEAAIEATADSICITDIEGSIIYVNPAYSKLTGYSKEECIGRNPKIVSSGKLDASFYKKLWSKISTGKVFHGVFINRTKSGAEYHFDATITPMVNKKNEITAYVGVGRDITEKNRIEEQLRQSQKMQAIGQLTGGIAHDFNNRLTVILGNLQLVQRMTADDARLTKFIDSALNSTGKAARLTSSLLSFSRNQMLDTRRFNVNRQLLGMRELLQQTLGETIEIEYKIKNEKHYIETDDSEFENAILNLAINARDAMPDGGGLLVETYPAHITRQDVESRPYLREGNYVVVAVSDTGTGMSEEQKQHCFEPFYTSKAIGKGTGLGLAMVYGFIKQAEGFIHLYTEAGHGTCFKLYFPEKTGLSTSVENADNSQIELHLGEKKLKVLVVEDDPDVRLVATSLLEEFGCQILEARNGDEGISVFENNTDIDMILSDMIMPGGMTGLEMIYKVRKLSPDVRAIIASGYSEHPMSSEANITWMRKPYTRELLHEKIMLVTPEN